MVEMTKWESLRLPLPPKISIKTIAHPKGITEISATHHERCGKGGD